jgi:Cytosine/adenosine deaminases
VTHPSHAASDPGGIAPEDLPHLRRCVELAAEAVDAGDHPFGSVLVAADGRILAEDRNRENTMGDATRHPEFELARWAAANMTAADRAGATVFTSGEHCPMCAAAHAWVGLGRIVYVSSSEQLTAWLAELGVPPSSPVRALPVRDVAPGLTVQGRCRNWTSRSASCTAASAANAAPRRVFLRSSACRFAWISPVRQS